MAECERRLPARCPRPPPRRRTAAVAGRAGHLPGAVGLDRLDEQSQRHPDAGAALRQGEVAVTGRIGRQRLWDVADRVYPTFEPLPADEAQRRREQRRLRSLGLARAKTAAMPGEPIAV